MLIKVPESLKSVCIPWVTTIPHGGQIESLGVCVCVGGRRGISELSIDPSVLELNLVPVLRTVVEYQTHDLKGRSTT